MPTTLSSGKYTTKLPPVTQQSLSRASEERPIAAKKSLSKLGQSIISTETTSRLIKATSMSRSLTDKRNSQAVVTSQKKPERRLKQIKDQVRLVTQAKRETTGFGDFYNNVRKFESPGGHDQTVSSFQSADTQPVLGGQDTNLLTQGKYSI